VCLELVLITMGKQLGFNVYTADPSKTCGTTRPEDLADLSKKKLKVHTGRDFRESLGRWA